MSISVNEIRKLTYLLPRCGEDSSSCQFLVFPCAECSPKNKICFAQRVNKDENKSFSACFFSKESPISPQECHQSHNYLLVFIAWKSFTKIYELFLAIVYFYPRGVMLTCSLRVDGVSWEVIAREAPKRTSY